MQRDVYQLSHLLGEVNIAHPVLVRIDCFQRHPVAMRLTSRHPSADRHSDVPDGIAATTTVAVNDYLELAL